MPTLMRPILGPHRTLLSLSLSVLTASMSTTPPPPPSSSDPPTSTNTTPLPTWPTHPYTPYHTYWPYKPFDFTRADPTPDTDFYSAPRYVTHIDDHAIGLLKSYYAATLPRTGRILDFCSSWISHFPPALEEAATRPVASTRTPTGRGEEDNTAKADAEVEGKGTDNGGDRHRERELEVIGLGLSTPELAANPILALRITHDLNAHPTLPSSISSDLSAATCVVSIDYLTSPLEVLTSLRRRMKKGGVVHLVVSNRCFPSKVVGRWLRVDEEERVQMVGDYLWFSGWRRVEVVVLSDGTSKEGEGRRGWFGLLGGGRVDPLWVVRGVNTGEGFEGMGVGGEWKVRDEL